MKEAIPIKKDADKVRCTNSADENKTSYRK